MMFNSGTVIRLRGIDFGAERAEMNLPAVKKDSALPPILRFGHPFELRRITPGFLFAVICILGLRRYSKVFFSVIQTVLIAMVNHPVFRGVGKLSMHPDCTPV